jgi:hypothetical protein
MMTVCGSFFAEQSAVYELQQACVKQEKLKEVERSVLNILNVKFNRINGQNKSFLLCCVGKL